MSTPNRGLGIGGGSGGDAAGGKKDMIRQGGENAGGGRGGNKSGKSDREGPSSAIGADKSDAEGREDISAAGKVPTSSRGGRGRGGGVVGHASQRQQPLYGNPPAPPGSASQPVGTSSAPTNVNRAPSALVAVPNLGLLGLARGQTVSLQAPEGPAPSHRPLPASDVLNRHSGAEAVPNKSIRSSSTDPKSKLTSSRKQSLSPTLQIVKGKAPASQQISQPQAPKRGEDRISTGHQGPPIKLSRSSTSGELNEPPGYVGYIKLKSSIADFGAGTMTLDHRGPVVDKHGSRPLPPYVPFTPLSASLGDAPGIYSRKEPMTHAQVVDASERISAQLNDLKARLRYILPKDRFEKLIEGVQEVTDVPDGQARLGQYITELRGLLQDYSEGAEAAAELQEEADRDKDADHTRKAVEFMRSAREMLDMRWNVMVDKRRVIRMEIQYQKLAGKHPVEMEYPGQVNKEAWSANPPQRKPLKPGFEDPHSRRDILLDDLLVKHSCRHYMAEDELKCNELASEPAIQTRIEKLLEHPEIITFFYRDDARKNRSGGLLIMASELDHRCSSRPTTMLSAFMQVYSSRELDAKGSRTVMKHGAGLRHQAENIANGLLLAGVRGLLLSLCTQLLYAFESTQLRFLGEEGNDVINDLPTMHDKGLYNLRTLCDLFRDLLLDVADLAKDRLRVDGPQTIIVTIDSIHVLESDRQCEEFFFLVDYFRTLCDEACYGELKHVLRFKYVLLHPGMSKLLERPYPTERTVILEPQVHGH